MKTRVFEIVTCIIGVFASQAYCLTGSEILTQSGLAGGLVVHLGCGDGSLTTKLTTDKTILGNRIV